MDTINQDSSVIGMLEGMLLIRAYEEELAALQAAGNFPGTCTSVGQEASAVGVVRALGVQDRILTNHRSAGHLLARGADPGRLIAEVAGKATGYCKGKSGSLHIAAQELGVILTSTIVGGELSLVTGVGLSLSMQQSDAIAVCFFGDGAACEGIFHESLNLAAMWKLPVLYVCENNQWQAFVAKREAMPQDHISAMGPNYGIKSLTVDGNDVEAVLAAARDAAAYIRETGKPFLLETYTYRLRGHYEPDDQAYVDPVELADWKLKDPIVRQQAKLLAQGVLTPEAYAQMKQRIEERIAAAVRFAADSPYPAASELTTDVYA